MAKQCSQAEEWNSETPFKTVAATCMMAESRRSRTETFFPAFSCWTIFSGWFLPIYDGWLQMDQDPSIFFATFFQVLDGRNYSDSFLGLPLDFLVISHRGSFWYQILGYFSGEDFSGRDSRSWSPHVWASWRVGRDELHAWATTGQPSLCTGGARHTETSTVPTLQASLWPQHSTFLKNCW